MPSLSGQEQACLSKPSWHFCRRGCLELAGGSIQDVDICGHQPWCYGLWSTMALTHSIHSAQLTFWAPFSPLLRTKAAEERGQAASGPSTPCSSPSPLHSVRTSRTTWQHLWRYPLPPLYLVPHFPWNDLRSCCFPETLSPLEAGVKLGTVRLPQLWECFTKAWVLDWQRTVECHCCFCEAGAFQPGSVGILSKALGYRSSGESFCFLPAHLCDQLIVWSEHLLAPSPNHFLSYPWYLLLPCMHLFHGPHQVSLPDAIPASLISCVRSAVAIIPFICLLSSLKFRSHSLLYLDLVMLLLWAFHPWVSQFLLPSWFPVATLHPWRNWGQLLSKLILFPFVILGGPCLSSTGIRQSWDSQPQHIWGWICLCCEGLSCSV